MLAVAAELSIAAWLTRRWSQPGSMVRAGQPVGTLVGIGTYEVKSAIHARHLGRLKEGDDVLLRNEEGVVVARGQVARVRRGHLQRSEEERMSKLGGDGTAAWRDELLM